MKARSEESLRDLIEDRLKRYMTTAAESDPESEPARGYEGDFTLNPELMPAQDELIPAAVLVPLIDHEDEITVLLTRRSESLPRHAGQISFPGGRVEPDDTDLIDTALRETEEELGIGREHIEVYAYLDDYETGTGFRVTPIVAFVEPGLDYDPDPAEVAEIFEVPLAHVLDSSNHELREMHYKGGKRQFHALPYGDYYIWGATAGMLMNLYKKVMDE